MSDRELLEMAAKACGYGIEDHFGILLVTENAGTPEEHSFLFDPLEDDGDALI